MTMKKIAGYTIVEVLVGFLLLGTVSIAVIGAIVIGTTSGIRAKHKLQATYVMQQKIEALRKQTFSGIDSSTATVTIDTNGTPYVYTDDISGTQVVTVTPLTYYKKIVVKITWRETLWGVSKNISEYCGTHIANDPQIN